MRSSRPGLDGWRGGALVRIASLRTGANRLAGLEGRVSFGGDAGETLGTADLAAAAAATEAVGAARQIRFAGRYRLAPSRGDLALDGELAAQDVAATEAAVAAVARVLRGARETPVGPIGEALADAVTRAGRGGGEARAALRLAVGEGRGMLRLGGLAFESRSGARLTVSGGEG